MVPGTRPGGCGELIFVGSVATSVRCGATTILVPRGLLLHGYILVRRRWTSEIVTATSKHEHAGEEGGSEERTE